MVDYNNNKKMRPSSFCGLQTEPEASICESIWHVR